jgi:hypothetical protein
MSGAGGDPPLRGLDRADATTASVGAAYISGLLRCPPQPEQSTKKPPGATFPGGLWPRTKLGYAAIGYARGRPWDSKLTPIDYGRCCSDRLKPSPETGRSRVSDLVARGVSPALSVLAAC